VLARLGHSTIISVAKHPMEAEMETIENIELRMERLEGRQKALLTAFESLLRALADEGSDLRDAFISQLDHTEVSPSSPETERICELTLANLRDCAHPEFP
jgi:hypothetical protein